MGLSVGVGVGLTLNKGVGGKIAWRTRGLIAARISDPFAIAGAYAAGGTNTQVTENSRHVVAVDATNISAVFRNVRNGTDGPAFTVKCALWASASFAGGPTPIDYEELLWTGGSDSNRRSPSIAAGAYLESDKKAISGIAAGNLLMSRQYEIFASAPANWLGSELSIVGAGDETGAVGTALTDTLNSYVDFGGGAYYSYPSGGGAYQFSSPSLVLGDSATKKARICIINDSIGIGTGEGAGGLYLGWPQRLLQASYPWFLVGNSGYALALLLATTTERNRRLALLDLAGITHVLLQVITNDLPGGTGASALFLSEVDALQGYLNTLPLKPNLVLCTSTPRTDPTNTTKFSTDSSSTQSERLVLNAAIKAQTKYAVFDVAAYAQASGNANLWDTTGGKGTSDGIHPNPTTHAAIAAGLNAAPAQAFTLDRYL